MGHVSGGVYIPRPKLTGGELAIRCRSSSYPTKTGALIRTEARTARPAHPPPRRGGLAPQKPSPRGALAPKLVLANARGITVETIAAMYRTLTGKEATPEELAEIAAMLAAADLDADDGDEEPEP